MSEWYEYESELEPELAGEDELRFARSFRPPPARRAPAFRSSSRRPGTGRAVAGPPRAPAWHPGPRPSPFGPRPGRRRPKRRPWLLYGGPLGYGYPAYQPLPGFQPPVGEPPPEGVEPGAMAEPAPEPMEPPAAAEPPEEPASDARAAPPEQAGASSEEQQELEAQRGPLSARIISWTVRQIDRHPFSKIPAGGGLYVVEEDGVPLYVGETDSFQGRWRGRLLALYQVGLTRKGGLLPKPIKVWFGTIQPNTRPARTTAEHALIRALLLSGVVPAGHLRNMSSIRQFRVKGGVAIQGLLPGNPWGVRAARAPGLTGRALSLADKATYELFGR